MVVAASGVCDESGMAMVNVIISLCAFVTIDRFFMFLSCSIDSYLHLWNVSTQFLFHCMMAVVSFVFLLISQGELCSFCFV